MQWPRNLENAGDVVASSQSQPHRQRSAHEVAMDDVWSYLLDQITDMLQVMENAVRSLYWKVSLQQVNIYPCPHIISN